MANDNNNISGLMGLDPSLTTLPTAAKKKDDVVGKDEFLQLLVTQLKHQDPLDPLKNEEFAVQLATFSQLEQLMSINDKLDKPTEDLSSLATYLGHEVTLNSNTAHFDRGDGGFLKIDLPQAANTLTIELLNADGSIHDTIQLEDVSSGKHTLALTGPETTNGDFGIRVTATATQGGTMNIPASVAGIVTGFVPGPDPVLLLGTREVKPSDVLQIGLPQIG